MNIRSLVNALESITDRFGAIFGQLAEYVEYGVDTAPYENDLAVLSRINAKVKDEIKQGPEKVNPKWITSVVEVAEVRISMALRLEKGFLLNPYVRNIMADRMNRLFEYYPEARGQLNAQVANFDEARSAPRPANSNLRESFLSLVALIEDCEREATVRMVERVFKPAPPAPAKRDRNADRRERDRERRNAMKGKGGQKPARGKKAA